ncbi:hypothetical protein G7043_44365 [Lentzea sp. NEAU-D13]|uniref:Universal stress protein n=1 Tax=Lentzea alba TaxID=2714351 RepID=A0A7C9RYB6_9PSEU|nr:hypothetical protein [Lentzea alba]NGY65944.1 hypothetical protein [Lentzea alba]
MIIGVSGHQHLPTAARAHAERDIRVLFDRQTEPAVGMSSLAAGADQLFAQVVLGAGCALHAVIPAADYEHTLTGAAQDNYRRLLIASAQVTRLDFEHAGETAYYSAGRFIVDHCDLLVAVWDGEPARGLGGTADVVAKAREVGREVLVVWPQGVRRQ